MVKTIEFKKLDVMSVAKIFGLIGVVFGLLAGLFITPMSMMGGFAGVQSSFFALGALAIIAFPILYGLMYFIGGAIFAFVYNFIASKIGGIKVEI